MRSAGLPVSVSSCVQVERFLGFAENRSDLEFFVGPLGSQDHLGHKMDEMAALFAHRSLPPNVVVNDTTRVGKLKQRGTGNTAGAVAGGQPTRRETRVQRRLDRRIERLRTRAGR